MKTTINSFNKNYYIWKTTLFSSISIYLKTPTNTIAVDESLVTSKSKRFTRTLDQDGNNLLSRAEFQSWYYPSIEQKLNDEINFLLDSYDSDSDGYLQRKELIEHCDALAASQLTNFGLVFHAMENSSRKVEL